MGSVTESRSAHLPGMKEPATGGGTVIGGMWERVAAFAVLCVVLVVVVWVLPAGVPAWLVVVLAAGVLVLVAYGPVALARLLEAAGALRR